MHKMILKLGSLSICGKSFRNLRLWRVPFSRRSFMAASGSPRRNGERLSLIEGHSWRSVRCASFNATKKELGGNWVHGQEGNRAVLNDMGSEDKEEQIRDQNPNPRLLTLPTILTLGRVAAVPLLVTTFYMNGYWATTATTSIFIIAAVTDWLDGYLARKMRLGTAFGAFLDPVADKLMVAATLVLLCTKPFEVAMFGQVPWLLTVPSIAIIGREITMSAVREWAASQSRSTLEAVAVNNFGKWKTATQMIAITILLATRDSSQGSLSIIAASGIFLLYTSAGLSVWSLAVYMRGIWRILLK